MTRELSMFIYGSLAEGQVHYNKISPYIVEREDVAIVGQIFRLPSGYPVYIQTNDQGLGNERIRGQRVVLRAPEVVYSLMDEFHGVSVVAPEKSLFFKIQVSCEMNGVEPKDAFVYAMNPNKLPKNSYRVEGGDWLKNLLENPVLPQSLTEKQSTYIKKLNQSSGRDIVPIDISLYRELMKLDLIVDKGRRLALSKLGLEVARYLPD